MSRRPPPRHGTANRADPSRPRLYGRHAVYAALDNPVRKLRKLHGTHEELAKIIIPQGLAVQYGDPHDLARLIPADAPHQGLVLEVEPLESVYIDEVLDTPSPAHPLIVLDQVTDPHNVGAIIRSAAAFGARALITQDRHAPPESGALAKAASGCLEILPWVRVTNLARALDQIAEAGFWRIGLAGEARETLSDALGIGPVAIVMGAEGEGLRPNTVQHTDTLARLPIARTVESLNVSNAAAIALYAAASRGGRTG
ncbi:23S rRNA (guanosine(2251)-2'-O)-methyltransferase RlmB [Sandaracinobacteroides saxicola]|uniref:23S rRNA (Guanosine(2251)-2'-O)-methyltransferase RlmB n=1 Tax=Sandaracinobacteroides saxicola TaxID=2759707 RepID=A0A7G5IDQ4_9SPHN|nr:23S rRNA (guanosine(2251)-2'-O)-methyltransferase RlmB [Sandaracinobacteroides saxicola]QMW21496.1 23S rRNA (guanosine(2251)-2'-O)-methyltransferase RlmB [Sandaracinobacteroides saxicola]